MADDAVKQIVQSSPTASINAHPSLVQQRRSNEQRRGRQQDGDERQEKDDGTSKDGFRIEDTVTLSENAKSAAVSGNTVSTHNEKDNEDRRGTIDIRI